MEDCDINESEDPNYLPKYPKNTSQYMHRGSEVPDEL